jgi:cell wall-associated NlpC family hydrolase
MPHQSAKVVTRQPVVAASSSSDGQLPETVKTSKNVLDSRISISDPISDKRNSVVDFAQDFAASNKSTSPVRSTLMSRAHSLRGTPYRYGTSGGGTFDCSGFTSAMYRKVGVKLPRTAAEQFGVGLHIAKSSLFKGDLVFFRNTAGRRGISHVGIYSGNGMFIHASSRGHAVRIDTLNSGYYSGHFAGGRRLIR